MHHTGERVCSQVLETHTHTRVRNVVCRQARLRTHTRRMGDEPVLRHSCVSEIRCAQCVCIHTQSCIRTGERRHACMNRMVGLLQRLAGSSRFRPRWGQPRRQRGRSQEEAPIDGKPRPGAPFGCRIRARLEGSHKWVGSLPENRTSSGQGLCWRRGDRE